MLERLTAEDFRPHLNAVFRVDGAGGSIDTTLIAVAGLPARAVPQAARRAGFWIHLLGPAGPEFLPQGIYTVHHPALGPMDIFLVPLGPQAGAMRYEAIFN